jgi:hypothetical protein
MGYVMPARPAAIISSRLRVTHALSEGVLGVLLALQCGSQALPPLLWPPHLQLFMAAEQAVPLTGKLSCASCWTGGGPCRAGMQVVTPATMRHAIEFSEFAAACCCYFCQRSAARHGILSPAAASCITNWALSLLGQ